MESYTFCYRSHYLQAEDNIFTLYQRGGGKVLEFIFILVLKFVLTNVTKIINFPIVLSGYSLIEYHLDRTMSGYACYHFRFYR